MNFNMIDFFQLWRRKIWVAQRWWGSYLAPRHPQGPWQGQVEGVYQVIWSLHHRWSKFQWKFFTFLLYLFNTFHNNNRNFLETNDIFLGEGLTYLLNERLELAHSVLPHVRVFARVNPKQKESYIYNYK